MYQQDALPLQIFLHRWSMGPIDELGKVEDYAAKVWTAYAVAPFPSMFSEMKRIEAFHMDHEELDRRRARGEFTVKDLDLNKSGFQNVLGFHLEGLLQMGVYADPFDPNYKGPARKLPLPALAITLKCLVHEIGHYYQYASRIKRGTDDISRLVTAWLEKFAEGQTQASNFAEWFAEIFHHIATGKFSDDKVATLPPELVQLMRCAFWLSAALKDRWVVEVKPMPTGVMFQTYVGYSWRWRWYSCNDWQQKEYDGQSWKNI